MEEAFRSKNVIQAIQAMEKIGMESIGQVDGVMNFGQNDNKLGDSCLLQLKAFLVEFLGEVGRLINKRSKDDVVIKAGNLGKSYLEINDTSMIEPRGRFNVTISFDGMRLEGKSCDCIVMWDNISNIACVPSNMSTKKEGEELLAISLVEPIKCNNKDLKSLLWSLNKAPNKFCNNFIFSSIYTISNLFITLHRN